MRLFSATNFRRASGVLCATLFFLTSASVIADPAEISGGGNFTPGPADGTHAQFEILRASGGRAIRINVYPHDYYDGKNPSPEKLDALILAARAAGVEKIVLLFEYYGHYATQTQDRTPLGGYEKWRDIGQAFAARFSPTSSWLRSKEIHDWGVTVFQAFNEPDGEKPADAIPLTGPSSYPAALRGLADGVRAVNKDLAVIPGGFMAANASSDFTLRGFGPALAPLWNDGTLDGIDLHTYNDVAYAPIVRKDGGVVFGFSPQANFDAVKKACHVTRNIHFYATEYNFKANEQGIDDALAAKRLLTCIWANLGVVGNDGETQACQFALIWNLFHTSKEDKTYGLNLRAGAWTPSPRGEVFQRVMALTRGMDFTSLDPGKKGVFTLEGDGRKLWVWQNYEHWTDTPGSSFNVSGVPGDATKLQVHGWDGFRKSIELSGQDSLSVTDLKPNETYMFLAQP